MGFILMSAESARQDHDPNVSKGVRVQVFLNFCSSLSGSSSQTFMGPILMWAKLAGQDHDPNVPKGVRVQVFFEFLLQLIRKWFPDIHGAHPDVGQVDGSRP